MNKSKSEQLFDLDLISISDIAEVSEPLFSGKQNSESTGKKFIIFMINEILYGIASNKVSEVLRPLHYTSLPNLPDWFLGIANLRGDIISIINLEALWSKESNNSPKSKLIVLHSDNSEPHIAFKVDKFSEIVSFEDKEIKHLSDNNSKQLFGTVQHKSNTINLLNVEEILSSLKLN